MRSGFYAFFLGLMCSLLLLSGCTDDYFDPSRISNDLPGWEPDLALPLVSVSLSASDLFISNDSTGSYTDVAADGLISIVYRSTILSIGVNDLFFFPPVSFPYPMGLTDAEIATFQNNGQISKNFTNDILFQVSPGGEELDSVRLAQGVMQFSFTNTFNHPAQLVVTMPNVVAGGIPFSRTYPVGANSTVSDQIDLTGYAMDLSATVNGFNQLRVRYDLNLTHSGGSTNTSQQMISTQSFTDMRFSHVYGYFAQQLIPVPMDTVSIDLFNNAIQGNVHFVDPKFSLTVNNSFGVPMGLSLDQLSGWSNFTGAFPFNQTVINGVEPIGAPGIGQIGQSVSTTFTFDRNSSNIDQLLDQRIGNIVYQLSAQMNPAGHAFNFATDQSRVEVVADMEVPLWGRATGFVIQDTIPFPESDFLADKVSEGMIRVGTVNGFPADATIQLIFLDENGHATDSLQQTPLQTVIRSGTVGSNGRVTSPTETKIDFPVPAEKVRNVFGCKTMVIRASMNTTDGGTTDIKFYSDYRLDLRLSIQVKMRLNPNGF